MISLILRIVLLTIILAGIARAETVTVMRVIDGDTIITDKVCLKGDDGRVYLWRLRLAGIDTPESRRPPARCQAEVEAGKAATAFLRATVPPGAELAMSVVGPDKWGCRVVARAALSDGRDLSEIMIAAGHARPYDGGRKLPWCAPRKRSPSPDG